jgi:hypothetical protein
MHQLYCRGWLEENTGAKAQVDDLLQFVSDQAAAFIGRYSLKLWHAKSPHESKFRRWKHRRADRMDCFEGLRCFCVASYVFSAAQVRPSKTV